MKKIILTAFLFLSLEAMACSANFIYKTFDCDQPGLVSFSDRSSIAQGGVVTYSWDFGDGGHSSLASPSHTFIPGRSYHVCLHITEVLNGQTYTSDFCQDVAVASCCQIVAGFDPLLNLRTGVVHFDNTSSGILSSASYSWDFGDGTQSNLEDPIHQFYGNGPFNVCLTVRGKDVTGLECENIFCDIISICGAQPPIDTPTCNIYADLAVSTQGSMAVATPYTNGSYYYIDFGDGSYADTYNQNFVHTYAQSGYYTVCIYSYNGVNYDSINNYLDTCTAYYCQTIYIETDTPSCNIYADLAVSTQGSMVVATPYTNGSYYHIDFGDGAYTNSYDQNFLHTYAQSGYYTICIYSYNGATYDSINNYWDSCTAYYCQTIYIETDTPSCNIYADLAVSAQGSMVVATPYTNGSSYYIDFGDGAYTNSYDQNFVHTYAQSGYYTICIYSYTNSTYDSINHYWDSCTAYYCQTIYVGVDSSDGLQGLNEPVQNFNLFPSPVGQDGYKIKFNTSNPMDLYFDIHSVNGQLITSHSLKATKGINEFQFSSSNLAQGSYIGSLRALNETFIRKYFIKSE